MDIEELKQRIQNTTGLLDFLRTCSKDDNPVNVLLDMMTEFYGIPWEDIDIQSFEEVFHYLESKPEK